MEKCKMTKCMFTENEQKLFEALSKAIYDAALELGEGVEDIDWFSLAAYLRVKDRDARD